MRSIKLVLGDQEVPLQILPYQKLCFKKLEEQAVLKVYEMEKNKTAVTEILQISRAKVYRILARHGVL